MGRAQNITRVTRAVIEESIRNAKITTSLHCISIPKKSDDFRPIVLGQCHASTVANAAKVVVKRLELNPHLFMYVPKFEPIYAYDPKHECRVGDITLIELLPKQMTRDITHRVLKVIYPMGDVRDPVTGKLCVGNEYREDMQRKAELWGQNENAFDYDKAPPRGWQEGRKDWSHKEGYRRWHDFTDRDQEEAEHPPKFVYGQKKDY